MGVAMSTLHAKGRACGRPVRSAGRVFMAVTGLLLFAGLGKLLARYVLGYRRAGEISLTDDGVTYAEQTRLAGREIRNRTEVIKRDDVLSVEIEQRYPFLWTIVGMACLCLGVLLGIIWIMDGVQGEFVPWILSGVGVLLLGVLLDLALTTINASLPGTVVLALHLPGDRVVRLLGVDPAKAAAVSKAI